MNKINILNKLRKKYLDKQRKKQLKKLAKIVISHYVDGSLLTFYVGNPKPELYFGGEYQISENSFEFVLKFLEKLGIKYTKVTTPIFETPTPYKATIKFIYEEE